MTTITITLSDDRLQKLKEIANRFGVAPEELVRVSTVHHFSPSTVASSKRQTNPPDD